MILFTIYLLTSSLYILVWLPSIHQSSVPYLNTMARGGPQGETGGWYGRLSHPSPEKATQFQNPVSRSVNPNPFRRMGRVSCATYILPRYSTFSDTVPYQGLAVYCDRCTSPSFVLTSATGSVCLFGAFYSSFVTLF